MTTDFKVFDTKSRIKLRQIKTRKGNAMANVAVLVMPWAVILFSYETPVAVAWHGRAFISDAGYSNTTQKHIRAWLYEYDNGIASTMPRYYVAQERIDAFLVPVGLDHEMPMP
jgi:hypothetical protein